MSRATRTWSLFGLCAAALLGALAWITDAALDLERREAEAQASAQFHEALSLALWRLEARLIPLVAAEASRPPEHYAPYYEPEQALANDRTKAPLGKGQVLLASPLLATASEFFRLYFEVDAQGNITSPQIPDPASVGLAGDKDRNARVAAACQADLAAGGLGPALYQRGRQIAWPPAGAVPFPAAAQIEPVEEAAASGQQPRPQQYPQTDLAGQQEREFASRWASNRNAQTLFTPQSAAPPEEPAPRGPLDPAWLSPSPGGPPELFLLRRVTRGGNDVVQGIWVDWPKLKTVLLEEVRELLPGADLVPVLAPRTEDAGRLLASIPAALAAAVEPVAPPGGLSPLRITLLVTWGAVLTALLAVGLVLRAALDLGERRGRFVSAVTHELRTPLTTFRMYAQMLAEGMVSDDTARREYLDTLRSESERLTRVVESVLLYSRLEEGRGGAHRERVEAGQLLERVLPPLAQRALAGQMELVVDAEQLGDVEVDVDVQAVEQILLNLVDNACKYAAAAHDRRLHLQAASGDGRVWIRFWDHGPGIPEDERSLVFVPFKRLTRHRAGPIPGVGLGLALARGLARALDGDLRLAVRDGAGAAFVLTLPEARPRGPG